MRIRHFLLLMLVLGLVLACSASSTGTTTPAATTVTIKGQTLYSADGGTTTQPANFQFDVPASAAKGIDSRDTGSADWISVTGQIRAGDILINLTGAFNTVTKEFNLAAEGVLSTLTIDITIKGLYTPSTGAVSQGQTDVAVSDSSTGKTLTFSTPTVSSGQNAAIPIASAPTTASKPTSTNFWEGVWTATDTTYYNADGTVSSTPTSIYFTNQCSVTVTATQFQERINMSGAAPASWNVNWNTYTFYQTGSFIQFVSQTSSDAVAIIQVNVTYGDGTTASGYMKGYMTQTTPGEISGGPYYATGGTNQWLFPTASDALNLGVTRGNGTSGLTLKKTG